MISFQVLSGDSGKAVIHNLSQKHPECDAGYISEITEQLLSLDDGCEYALSFASGCLLIRVFDEEYLFLFPEPVCDEYDLPSALDALRLYAIREEIPLVICEVPGDYLEELSDKFAGVKAECEDKDVPIVSDENMTLAPLSTLSPADEKKYAALCRDKETNKYWGYDFSEDCPDCPDSWFIESAESEFSRGVAVSFAIKLDGEFIGEAMLYAFDLLGGAECALRLLPEHRGKNLSSRCVSLLAKAAEMMHINNLYATVDNKNVPSLCLFSKTFKLLEKNDEKTRFVREM